MMREKARAKPPRIIVLTVLPSTYRTTNVANAGEWNGKKYRERGAQAPKEDQDHQAGERPGRSSPSCEQRLDGLLDECGLVEHHRWPPDSFGMPDSWPIMLRMPSTTAMVLVSPPCFMMGR